MKRIVFFLCVLMVSTSAFAQYCTPTYNSGCSSADFINNFTATGGMGINISNLNTGCNGLPPSNTIVLPLTVAEFPGGLINITVQSGSSWGQGFRIWVDWNNDLLFTPGESVWNSSSSSTALQTGSFMVPMSSAIGNLRMRVMCRYATVPLATDFCATGLSFGEVEDYTLQVLSPTPCSGAPTAGTINGNDTVNLCPSAGYTVTVSGTSQVSSLTYIWQQATPPGSNTWTTIAGATLPYYIIAPGQPPADYRMVVLCNNSFQFDTTNTLTVLTALPKKAQVPYTQSFESWMDYCANSDVPDDSSWTNSPFMGDLSWRRDDEGSTANWNFPTASQYFPASSHLNHSARIHTYYATAGGSGNLDLHIDLSAFAGTKTLNFDYITNGFSTQPALEVLLSTNGGNTFTSLGSYNGLNGSVWDNVSLPIASNSNDAVIRFQGSTTSGFWGDIGIDNLSVLQPCTGTPNAGIIADTTACPNTPFMLTLSGSSLAGGLSYQWQSAPSAAGPWTTFSTTTQPFTIATQPGTTWYRCTVTCTNSGQSSTTPVIDVTMNTFYYCYCQTAQPPPGSFDYIDIGNVYISKETGPTVDTVIWNAPMAATDTFNNTSATAGYTNYQFSYPMRKIMRDSTYKARTVVMTQFTWSPGSTTRIFIDYNRDGVFQSNEVACTGANNFFQNINNYFSSSFTVPNWASPGITGLRVINNFNSPIDPCDPFFGGETEDYLVEIELPKCDSVWAGSIWASDTITCPGYDIVLIDTTHVDLQSYTGLSGFWQRSTNGGSTWTNVPGTSSDTLIVTPSVTTKYRYMVICTGGDTAFSTNTITVTMINSSACYPASGAQWGSLDTADNGAFGIGSVLFTVGGGGPHLGNPAATRSRTDLSGNPAFDITLWTDSTYNVSFYNILKPLNHADAKITMFVDYNGNGLYDIPQERVFTGLSTANNFVTTGSFVTPLTPILGTPTGLRVVLNNNTAPNPASDNGVGLYVSGETEDYRAVFRKTPVYPASIADPLNLSSVSVYPNPTDGMVFIDIAAKQLSFLNVIVTTVTGQEVFRAQHKDVDGKFSTSIDLGNLAAGTYMLKLQTDKGSVVRNIVLN
ncbi:MAG: hypothetical protein RL660_1233 [Bacteroidota bacterium]|jgi:hypothetical protein